MPGVGGQGFDVAPLAFGEDGVKGEGGLPGPGESGEDDHRVAGQVKVHVAQIVFPGPLHEEARQVRTVDRSGIPARAGGSQGRVVGLNFNGMVFSYGFRHGINANRKLLRTATCTARPVDAARLVAVVGGGQQLDCLGKTRALRPGRRSERRGGVGQ